MKRQKFDPTEYYSQVMKAMTSQGLLLGSQDAAARSNIMTIGWGAIGNIWGVPVWSVLVRPSRYTCQCIEHTGCFTVNVPDEALGMACAICGSKSGRDSDKFALNGLKAGRASHVLAPIVEECPIVYECQVVHSSDILPAKLTDEIRMGSYLNGDYHRLYFGKILAAWADADAVAKMPK